MSPRVLRIGYFGKVPSTGDFVARNVDRGIRDALDAWLQASIEDSRRTLGEAWMHSFLTAPVWRLLSTRVGDAKTVLGVMIPSVDKVGRYFPFLVLAELAPLQHAQDSLYSLDLILDLLEPLALSALDDDFDLDHLSYQLGMAEKQANALKPDILQAPRNAGPLSGILPPDGELRAPTILWTDGSDYRQADLIVSDGLPKPGVFAALLRDPNVFRDLEAIWDECRHLKLGQHDNAQVDIATRRDDIVLHGISHSGKQSPANLGYADISADHSTLIISDGRFGVQAQAMAARFVCRALPVLWNDELGCIAAEDIDRLVAFLATKYQPQSTTLLPPLSFAMVRAATDGSVSIAVAGDYMCLLAAGETIRLFATGAENDDNTPTVRKEAEGRYQMVTLEPGRSVRVLLAGNTLTHRAVEAAIADSLAAPDVDTAAISLLQESMIRGLSGNICLGVADCAPARQHSIEQG